MAWTDERLDDAVDRVWHEFGDVRAELRAIRGEMAANQRQSLQMSWLIVGILLTQVVVYALAH